MYLVVFKSSSDQDAFFILWIQQISQNSLYQINNKILLRRMKKQVNVLATSDSGFRITLNQSNQGLQQLFSQFKEDFNSPPPQNNHENTNLLTLQSIPVGKVVKSSSKDKKRMKLIDYIYIKNTAKKNQNSKRDKHGLSPNQLRKSRIKQGKQKAFKAIVDQMVFELKQLSGTALAMADLANQNLIYSGNTDDITKLCNIRRILKDSIINNMSEIQKIMGVQAEDMEARSRQKNGEEQQLQLKNQLKRFQALGVQRLQCDNEYLNPHQQNALQVKQKNSNKDTWISQKLEQREEP